MGFSIRVVEWATSTGLLLAIVGACNASSTDNSSDPEDGNDSSASGTSPSSSNSGSSTSAAGGGSNSSVTGSTNTGSGGGSSGSGGASTGSTGTTGSPTNGCDRAASVLRSCGLLSGGETGCDSVEVTATLECYVSCYEATSCANLEALLCTLELDPTFGNCLSACDANAPSFVCDDGTNIPEDWQCDGFGDCDDASDEVGCATFVCGDGTSVPPDFECDGFDDCVDGSDEAGCPTVAQITCPS